MLAKPGHGAKSSVRGRDSALPKTGRVVRLGTRAVEHETGSRIRAQQLARHFSLCDLVKHLAGAVQRDDVVDVQLLESYA